MKSSDGFSKTVSPRLAQKPIGLKSGENQSNNGSGGRDQTCDLRVNSTLLLSLSYPGTYPKQYHIHVSLPFIHERKVPKLRKYAGESRYGFSEDDELIESALDELIEAMSAKDHAKVLESIQALIRCIKNREDSDAVNPQQDAQSI